MRRKKPHPTKSVATNSKTFTFGIINLVVALLLVFLAFLIFTYLNRQDSSENVTKLADLPLASQPYDQLIWGSFRPQLYFGLRNRHPQSPLFGLMWYEQPNSRYIRFLPIRHWCEHDDHIHFMWNECDGRSFGHQVVREEYGLNFNTDWLNRPQHSWSSRVVLNNAANRSIAFVFYLALQEDKTQLELLTRWRDDKSSHSSSASNTSWAHYEILAGSSPIFGEFSLSLRVVNGLVIDDASVSYVARRLRPDIDAIHFNDVLLQSLRWNSLDNTVNENVELRLSDDNDGQTQPDFVAVQVTLKEPSIIEIHFDNKNSNGDPSVYFDEEFQHRRVLFQQKFERTFPISDPSERQLGRMALANLLGGIGFWHGSVLVRSDVFNGVRPYGPLSLLSAVPSRPFFPRGFIWDEGFHNLLIAKFDPSLSLEILAAWLDTMNEVGWIPREMILGSEAQAKVPAEFLVQSDSVANPPVFFYLIEKFLKDNEFMARHGVDLRRMYPRLKRLYLWLRATQSGPRLGTFRWRGRNATTIVELNPKTLPSGLDDYPRASHPSDEEYHLDLRCWMAVASRVLRMLSEQADDSSFTPIVEKDMRILNDPSSLNSLHWSNKVRRYADYGLHSTNVRLTLKRRRIDDGKQSKDRLVKYEEYWTRDVLKEPTYTLVEDTNGCVSLFPFLLKLIPANSPKLAAILKNLDDPEELWSPYGLRSLSKRSPYYMARNTEHDQPYWRGAIWINMNYLALEALAHYARQNEGAPDDVQVLARTLHDTLRANLVRTITNEFNRTGFFWENYNDENGYGQGTRPFTGWTALILDILAQSQ